MKSINTIMLLSLLMCVACSSDSNPVRTGTVVVVTPATSSEALLNSDDVNVLSSDDQSALITTPDTDTDTVTINEDTGIVYNEANNASNDDGTDSMTPMFVSDDNEDSFTLHDVAFDLLYDLGGYKADQLALIVDVMAYETINDESNQFVVLPDEESGTGNYLTTIRRTQYNCSGGGTLIHEIGRLRFSNGSSGTDKDIDAYVFDQCQFSSGASPLVVGEYIGSGTLRISWTNSSGSRVNLRSNSFTWEQFQLSGPGGLGFALSGNISEDQFSSFTGEENRTVELDYYRKWVNEVEVDSLSNVNFRYDTSYTPLGSNDVQIEMSGVVAGTHTNNNEVSINTDTPLHHFRNSSPYLPDDEPFTGLISMNSSEGSSMIMSANTSGTDSKAVQNLLVDWTNTASDGTRFTDEAVLLISYTMSAENCDYSRPDTNGPVACADGQNFVGP